MMHRHSVRDRGSAALELVVLAPLLLLAGMVALQFGVVGWTAVSTSDAARAAARAAAEGEDPRAAASGALPDGLTPVSVSGGAAGNGYSYTVTVETPSFLPMVDLGSVSRTADMPAFK